MSFGQWKPFLKIFIGVQYKPRIGAEERRKPAAIIVRVCLREPLNKSSAAVSGSFPPILPYRKREIHTVFRPFRYFDWPENLSLAALADFIILFLNKMISSFYSAVSRQTA